MIWSGLTVILAVCATLVASGSQKTKGPCPELKTMDDFDHEKFLGTWYEIGHYNRGFPGCGDCLAYKFTKRITGFGVSVIKNGDYKAWGTFGYSGSKSNLFGSIEYDGFVPMDYHMKVLYTDYKCVATVYTCKKVGDQHISSAYLLSTDPTGMCYILGMKAGAAHDSVRNLDEFKFEEFERNEQRGCKKPEQPMYY